MKLNLKYCLINHADYDRVQLIGKKYLCSSKQYSPRHQRLINALPAQTIMYKMYVKQQTVQFGELCLSHVLNLMCNTGYMKEELRASHTVIPSGIASPPSVLSSFVLPLSLWMPEPLPNVLPSFCFHNGHENSLSQPYALTISEFNPLRSVKQIYQSLQDLCLVNTRMNANSTNPV